MGKLTIRLTIFWKIDEGNRMHLMFDYSGNQVYDSDHYLKVAKVRERLAVNKQRPHRFHMQRFNIKKLIDVVGKEQFRVEVSNRFRALEGLDARVEINCACKTIRI
jgi:hypothetical protein